MPRRVTSAEFVVSAVLPRDFPTDGRPEVALVGRSNVGKSSLINAVVRSAVARTSASPGKTRQVNVYRITPAGSPSFYLMDLPGYGHTGGGEKAQREFAALTALYFGARISVASPLCAVVLAVDARHPGLAGDVEACRWLHALGVPFLLTATKADKLSQSEKAKLTRACLEAFGEEPLPVSTITGAGLDEFWQRLRQWTSERI
jgi:GTP-binding protein